MLNTIYFFYLVFTLVKFLFLCIYFIFLYSYNRQHNLVPGKFSLNIRGIPESIDKNYTKHLYSLISYLVVKSEYLPIQIHTLNNMDMIPRYILFFIYLYRSLKIFYTIFIIYAYNMLPNLLDT